MPVFPPASLVHGRGAPANNLSQRFDRIVREADGDWLDAERTFADRTGTLVREDAADPYDPERANIGPAAPRTEVSIEKPKTAITRNQSPDVPFDRSINAYRGCEHGCVYCFARPTHAYLGLSPGQDFETRLTAKPDIPALLRRELSKPNYQCRPIALGTNTDPYQPIEARYRITRGILKVLENTGHPVTITTKSARVCEDIDILARMAKRRLAAVMLSVTTLDPRLAGKMEPRASYPARRIAAIRDLTAAGIPVHVSVSPVIPAINDHEIEAIVEAAATAGAVGAFSIVVRLPHEVSPIFREWLAAHFPNRASRVMSHLTEMRGGKDNEADFFKRFQPKGAYAAMLRDRFRKAAARWGLDGNRLDLSTDLFAPPGQQLKLF
ncbi:PA0069 family radical SAM protein [Pacificimonas sp. WHA3]|uniref:PA0069 family radical SAM protein n=1 Tax=Pacificimonas pallii TaxID=2827236 RepID=A0ABS6SEE3_9SPHN|nr:PA0069 family radical SAM protein [Pacificimonas pallii]MBV7256458.1 PA0069 family radical SAM protein [Pacificimonas pallii]